MNGIRRERGELQQSVIDAAELFLLENPGLLGLRAHEQAVSHRIAYYLEASFQRPGDGN